MYVEVSDVSTLAKSINASAPFNDHISVVVIGKMPSVCIYSILSNGEPVEVIKGPELTK
jgi:hypothetical protein